MDLSEAVRLPKGARMTRTNHHYYYLRIYAALAALVTASLLLTPGKPAEAGFPGENGKIAFSGDTTRGEGVDNPTGDFEIFTINPDGTKLERLTSNEADAYGPEYSPGGGRITLTSDRDGSSEDIDNIFKTKADGSDQKNLTETRRASEFFSAW